MPILSVSLPTMIQFIQQLPSVCEMDEIKDDFDLGNYLDEQDRALFGEDPGIMENDLLGEVLTEDAPLWAASADVPFEPDENHSNELVSWDTVVMLRGTVGKGRM